MRFIPYIFGAMIWAFSLIGSYGLGRDNMEAKWAAAREKAASEYREALDRATVARLEADRELRQVTHQLQTALAERNQIREENAREPVVITRVVEASECFYPDVRAFIWMWNTDATGSGPVPTTGETRSAGLLGASDPVTPF